jgi:hypothetical protein
MTIAQALTASRTQAPDLATIRADMEATRIAYHRLLDSLSDADLQRPCAISKWTIQELLCHMVLQIEQAVPMMVKQARKGKSMPRLLDTRFGHWNELSDGRTRGPQGDLCVNRTALRRGAR